MNVFIASDDWCLFQKTIKMIFAKLFSLSKHPAFPLVFQGVVIVSILDFKGQSFLSDELLWWLLWARKLEISWWGGMMYLMKMGWVLKNFGILFDFSEWVLLAHFIGLNGCLIDRFECRVLGLLGSWYKRTLLFTIFSGRIAIEIFELTVFRRMNV